MRHRFGACLVLSLAVATVLAAAAPASASAAESRSVGLVNNERTSRGLNAERVASDLVSVARRHSARMASSGRIYHNPNLGSEVGNWQSVGENVGAGGSVGKIHNAFMSSSGHRANILKQGDNFIGVGVVTGKDGKLYLTQIFVKRRVASSETVSRTTTRSYSPPPVAEAPKRKRAKPVKPPLRTVDVLLRLVEYS